MINRRTRSTVYSVHDGSSVLSADQGSQAVVGDIAELLGVVAQVLTLNILHQSAVCGRTFHSPLCGI